MHKAASPLGNAVGGPVRWWLGSSCFNRSCGAGRATAAASPSAPAMTLMFCTTLEYHALVSLPLWVLSALFPVLLPLAVTRQGIIQNDVRHAVTHSLQ